MKNTLLLGLVSLLCGSCTNNAERVHEIRDITNDPPLIVQHRLKELTVDNWRIESWLDGSSLATYYPIRIHLRFAPSKDNIGVEPKITTRIVIVHQKDKDNIRRYNCELKLMKCSELPKAREMPYFGNGHYGKTTDFPPKFFCWMATIENPFCNDRRDPHYAPFFPGNYFLTIDGSIANGPSFAFKDIPIELFSSGQRR